LNGPQSLRAAGNALVYWQRRQAVNANNLANTETPGFRAQRVFAEVLRDGVPRVGTVTDPRAGDLRQTSAPLDLALEGEGRFVVQTADGEKLVRSGSFSLDADGRIVDVNGDALMGSGGPLVLPPGPVEIDTRGGVSVAGERVGQIRVVRGAGAGDGGRGAAAPDGFDSSASQGAGLLSGGPSSNPAPGSGAPGSSTADEIDPSQVMMRQGYLEGSNVSALDSLVEMTVIQRSFQAVQNSVRTIDSVMDTVANRLGRMG
jgi:flagellar basal-body rod protein FlgF